jgi:hypothetical protein
MTLEESITSDISIGKEGEERLMMLIGEGVIDDDADGISMKWSSGVLSFRGEHVLMCMVADD